MAPLDDCSPILWLETANSTNYELRMRMSELDNLSVVAALSQTAGRGQGSHTWFASPGANLTFSVLLRFQHENKIDVCDAILITELTTLAIRDYLSGRGIISRIKWPNDIWVEDKKICGILIENTLDGTMIKDSIVGIGLNVNETDWPADLPNPVSMSELTGVKYELKTEMEALYKEICRRYSYLASSGGRKSLQEEFGKNMFRLDGDQR